MHSLLLCAVQSTNVSPAEDTQHSRRIGHLSTRCEDGNQLGQRGSSCYVAQAGLGLVILLPRFAKCWDDECVLPNLANDEDFSQWCWGGT